MATEPSTLRHEELKNFLDASHRALSGATVPWSRGLGLSAAPPGGKSSPVDIRTVATAIVALSELGDFDRASALCAFLVAVQESDGCWKASVQRSGTTNSACAGDDLTALAVWALMSYARVSNDQEFVREAREHVERAASFTRERTLNQYLYLVETTNSLHGPVVSAGYELWNNCAHAAAFALCHRVYGGDRFRRLALLIRRAISLHLAADGRFLRRLDPSGYPDPRPDVCLLAPTYFKLWSPSERMVVNSAEQIERTLWNVEFGGYLRYLPFSTAERGDLPGPSPRFTAWLAQYQYELGNRDRAEAIVRWLFDNSAQAQLPEILVPATAASRYLAEQHGSATDGAGPDAANDERRQRLLAELSSSGQSGGSPKLLPIGAPFVLAHLETLRALRKGGYLESWRADSGEARFHTEEPGPEAKSSESSGRS